MKTFPFVPIARWGLLGLLLVHCAAGSTAEHSVTFVVRTIDLPEDEVVFVAGHHDRLGQWEPNIVPLTRKSRRTWETTLSFESGTALEYKFTLGAWDREALAPNGTVPPNSTLVVREDTTVEAIVYRWRRPALYLKSRFTGPITTYREVPGDGILPRDIMVWMPPSYPTNDTKRYPVLYVHDGQQVFDPATSTHGVEWGLDETATRLMSDEWAYEALIVAIHNTRDRWEEYSETPKGDAYRRFVTRQLKPFIDSNFRTLPGREHTAVMGASLGARSALLLAVDHADTFSMVACLSPSFSSATVRRVEAWEGSGNDLRIYMDNGSLGVEQRHQPLIDWMLETLLAKGFEQGRQLAWRRDPAGEHNEASWARRVYVPLLFLFAIDPQAWKDALTAPPRPMYASKDALPKAERDLEALWLAGVDILCRPDSAGEQMREAWRRLEQQMASADPGGQRQRVALVREEAIRSRRYFAGVRWDRNRPLPPGLSSLEIPAGRVAVVPHTGSFDALENTLDYLFRWWSPRSGRAVDNEALIFFNGPVDVESSAVPAEVCAPLLR